MSVDIVLYTQTAFSEHSFTEQKFYLFDWVGMPSDYI